MPKISLSDVVYALGHPLRALRYLRHRDTISYEICARYLPANPVIIEAGAYDGSNTRDFCRFWPECQVYAFEPDKNEILNLEKTNQLNSNKIEIVKKYCTHKTDPETNSISLDDFTKINNFD
jgi:precorrin-6B methylase 2